MQSPKSIPDLQLPSFGSCSSQKALPARWESKAILHPFSPPPEGSTPESPFFELCIANIAYIENEVLSIQIAGASGRTWWYKIDANNETKIWINQEVWLPIITHWTLPTTTWMSDEATCVGSSPICWLQTQTMDWWKQSAGGDPPSPAIWFWLHPDTGLPFRLMFGGPPPAPEMGDPNQLAFFQNFSFTYFPVFNQVENPNIDTWVDPQIEGFQFGNPDEYEKVIWHPNFGMTVFMTPANAAYAPLPTRVLYKYESEEEYEQLEDRAQSTLMYYTYNQDSSPPIDTVNALLYGFVEDKPFPYAGQGFSYTVYADGGDECEEIAVGGVPIGQQPPNWAYLGEGVISACVSDNSVLSPGQVVTITAIVFPPSKQYPQGRYLWTWYALLDKNGLHSRPVTFMESASAIGVGTSLSLADYFDYQELAEPIAPSYFNLPEACHNLSPGKRSGAASALGVYCVTHAAPILQLSPKNRQKNLED